MNLKKRCSNMTRARKYISGIIKSFNIGDIIEDTTIQELVQYHPTKQIDINKIEWLKIKLRQPYNKPALFYKYKNGSNEDDISWILCIRNLYGKYNRGEEYIKDVKTAFRNESHKGTKKQYFIRKTNVFDTQVPKNLIFPYEKQYFSIQVQKNLSFP